MSATPIAIAVVEQAGRFLVGQRPAGVPLAGLWEFPGGKLQWGETPETAAVRECLEETGIEVRVTGSYPEHVQEYDHDRVRLHFIACQPLARDSTPRSPFRWVPRQELPRLDFPIGNRGLLQILLQEFLSDPSIRCNGPPEK